MDNNSGMLSIENRNIFSILKKWLYADRDIVFRELISNAADAIEKLSRISVEDESAKPDAGLILVKLDKEKNLLVISDNGIGMSRDEVHKYINQIAFSGAEDFIGKNGQSVKDAIIGHFGVGFYSAFMLADHVAIETKSYKKDCPAVRWDCMADMSYSMTECGRTQTGTDIILYLSDASPYFSQPKLVYDIIRKYFIFERTAIYFEAPGYDHVMANDPRPIWKMAEDSVITEDMNAFYREFFGDASDPLFWLRFSSIDIGVKGILFFRNTKRGTEELDGIVKIYSRGVYIGENIPGMIPKFVGLQNGIVECDNLPLVVSRSGIREDADDDGGMIPLISECLSQEVTIAFNDMFTKRRKEYERYWPETNAFVKYGILQDKTFSSVMARKVVFMDVHGNYRTVQEYVDGEDNTRQDTVFYASDKLDQAHYIEIFKKCGLNALLFDHVIDKPLLYRYETLYPKLKFIRIDSDIESVFSAPPGPDDRPKAEALKRKFELAVGERLGEIGLKVTRLTHESVSALIVNDEKSRRLADMMEIYGYLNADDLSAREKQSKSTLLLNLNNHSVRFILESTDEAAAAIVANQLFDLALMSQQSLKPGDVESFITRSEDILASFIEKSAK